MCSNSEMHQFHLPTDEREEVLSWPLKVTDCVAVAVAGRLAGSQQYQSDACYFCGGTGIESPYVGTYSLFVQLVIELVLHL